MARALAVGSGDVSVRLESISKSFGASVAVHPLTLSIDRGVLLALLGPSGCGKTTTLRIIAGLERPDGGRVSIDGTDVTPLPPERRGLGMVFQQYAVWPHRDVAGNVAYPLERQGLPRAEVAKRVEEALGLVHLEGLGGRRPHELSGGQLQRVALARALIARPRVLLLDEPLSNLDARLREELRVEIRALKRRLEITTILVTHDQEEALAIADRVAVMSAGRIEQVGTPAEVFASPATPFVARFVGGGNAVDADSDGSTLRAGAASLAAPPGAPAGPVTLVARPSDLRLDPRGVPMTVVDRLYLGDRVELRLDWEGNPMRAVLAASEAAAAKIGSTLTVVLGNLRVLRRT